MSYTDHSVQSGLKPNAPNCLDPTVRVIYVYIYIYMFIYLIIRETSKFSSKGIIDDFIGNLNRLTVSRRFTEQAV